MSLGRVIAVMGTAGLVGCFVPVDVGGGLDAGSDARPDGGAAMDAGHAGGPCSSTAECLAGETCFNGVCAASCQSGSDCASGQYCDQLCHADTPATCGDGGACGPTQVCVEGYCSTPPTDPQCDEYAVTTGTDGCDAGALCINPVGANQPSKGCFTLPACGADGRCPPGEQGAVCNDGYVKNKGRVCLIGVCKTAADCPAGWACVNMLSNDPVGACSDGSSGSACSQPSDCKNTTCNNPVPGWAGVCL
jgi:hypothetical protein